MAGSTHWLQLSWTELCRPLCHNMVVDMSGVEYISSAGLRALAAVLVKSRAEGGDMKLAALNTRVTRVFNIIGFDLLMSIHATPEAAIADFSSGVAS